MNKSPNGTLIAIVTGERGQREIVRPFRAVGCTVEVIDWETLRAGGRFPRLALVWQLWKGLRRSRSQTVFTDMSSVFLAAILALARLHNCKVILRLRGDLFAESRDQIRFHFKQRAGFPLVRALVSYGLDRLCFPAVDHYVPVSQWIVDRLRIASRSTIARIPCDPKTFNCRAHTRVGLKLLAVTNFNYPLKVAAMGQFLETAGEALREEGISVSIAGSGIALEQFRQTFYREAEFLGHVSAVGSLYAQYDAFVHFSGLDAFPYVVLEAQAAALPVLVNNACGMLEQVEEGLTGFIVNLDQPDQVLARLRLLSESPELRQAIGSRARQWVGESYSLEVIGASLVCAILRAREA